MTLSDLFRLLKRFYSSQKQTQSGSNAVGIKLCFCKGRYVNNPMKYTTVWLNLLLQLRHFF